MMEIKCRALPLLAISDHRCRNSPFRFGVLLGYRYPETITVADAFDIKHDAHSLDVAYVQKKVALVQTVSPAMELLGLYTCDEECRVPPGLVRQLAEIANVQPLLLLVPSTADGDFKCFEMDIARSPDTPALIPAAFTLVPGESEVTAVSTVQNHSNYSQPDSDLVQESDVNLGPSLVQLEEHLNTILAHDTSDPTIEGLLVHLAHLVHNYEEKSAPENLELYASHLSLLASQISTSKCADAQTNTSTSAISMREYRPRVKEWRKRA